MAVDEAPVHAVGSNGPVQHSPVGLDQAVVLLDDKTQIAVDSRKIVDNPSSADARPTR